jgi:hypothetical protein
MFILTRASRLENCEDKTYRVEDIQLEKEYLDAGYKRSERRYKLNDQYKEFTVICPEFRNAAKCAEPIVLIPEFLVPGRPYPVYVYMYAIDLYSGAPEKGQRWAAEETRKYFGLTSFAHTTLGRALKAFICIIDREAMEPYGGDTEMSEGGKKSNFPTVQSTARLRKQAKRIFQGRLIHARLREIISICCETARKWFKVYGCFLL